jgi:hypothetical protein
MSGLSASQVSTGPVDAKPSMDLPSIDVSSEPTGQTPYTFPLPGGRPPRHHDHTESTTTILVPDDNIAFLNPVQQYNRDLSVSVIRAWNELRKEELEKAYNARKANEIKVKEEKIVKKAKAQARSEGKEWEDEMGGEWNCLLLQLSSRRTDLIGVSGGHPQVERSLGRSQSQEDCCHYSS